MIDMIQIQIFYVECISIFNLAGANPRYMELWMDYCAQRKHRPRVYFMKKELLK